MKASKIHKRIMALIKRIDRLEGKLLDKMDFLYDRGAEMTEGEKDVCSRLDAKVDSLEKCESCLMEAADIIENLVD